MRRITTAILAATLSSGLVLSTVSTAIAAPVAAPAGLVAPAAEFVTPRAKSCAGTLKNIELFRSTSGFDVPSRGLSILNSPPVTIDLATFTIGEGNPYTDPSQTLWYRSLLWLALGAVNANEAGDSATANLLADSMIRATSAFPDPGSSNPFLLGISNTVGWDEGTAMRRAQALLCLSNVTGPARVDALLRAHAAALIDPVRYIGPPNRPVHNHGLMANITLLEIGDLLGDQSYRNIALSRLSNDYKTAFSAQGLNFEGSAHYHTVNINFWAEAVLEMNTRSLLADAAALSATLDQARSVARYYVSPTNVPVLVGNSRPNDGFLRPPVDPAQPLQFVDKQVGLAMNRWSWTDPKTTYWTAMNRIKRGAHGHLDRTSVTWQTDGVPVLTEVGQPDYDTVNNPLTIWSKSPAAQNLSVPTRVGTDKKKNATLDVGRKGSVDTVNMTSTQNGPFQTREMIVDDARDSVQISDYVKGGQAQHWHLARDWALQTNTGQTATLIGPAGRTLTVNTSPDATITSTKGSVAGGWLVTGFQTQEPAVELIISTTEPAITTTFSVQDAAKANDLAAQKVSSLSVPGRGRVAVDWSPTAPKPTGKANADASAETDQNATNQNTTDETVTGLALGSEAQKKQPPVAKPAVKITGYRVMSRKGRGPWQTAVVDTGSDRLKRVIKKLENGRSYRFRVAALGKRFVGPFGPQSKKFTPRTVPDGIEMPTVTTSKVDKAVLRAEKPKVAKKLVGAKITWTTPKWDGGAKVSGYQYRLPGEAWAERKGKWAQLVLDQKQVVVKVRAINEVGLGRTVKVVIARKGSAAVLVSPLPAVPPV